MFRAKTFSVLLQKCFQLWYYMFLIWWNWLKSCLAHVGPMHKLFLSERNLLFIESCITSLLRFLSLLTYLTGQTLTLWISAADKTRLDHFTLDLFQMKRPFIWRPNKRRTSPTSQTRRYVRDCVRLRVHVVFFRELFLCQFLSDKSARVLSEEETQTVPFKAVI